MFALGLTPSISETLLRLEELVSGAEPSSFQTVTTRTIVWLLIPSQLRVLRALARWTATLGYERGRFVAHRHHILLSISIATVARLER